MPFFSFKHIRALPVVPYTTENKACMREFVEQKKKERIVIIRFTLLKWEVTRKAPQIMCHRLSAARLCSHLFRWITLGQQTPAQWEAFVVSFAANGSTSSQLHTTDLRSFRTAHTVRSSTPTVSSAFKTNVAVLVIASASCLSLKVRYLTALPA